jgi:hypothetical protein
MAFVVSSAVKKALKIRMSIAGPSGSGKTLGALRVAFGLCGDWKKIVVIDTNVDDALVYAGDKSLGIGNFGHIPFPNPYTPKRFIEAINAAINYGAEVVVIDSASDEWAGIGGMLEMHDQVRGFNSAANWAKVNPEHQEFIKSMVEQKRAHIIATFRQKSKIAIDETEENGNKKSTVRRLGIESIARPGTEYDFLLAVELDRDTHRADIITKRGTMLPDMRPVELTMELGRRLRVWADAGDDSDAPAPKLPQPPEPPATVAAAVELGGEVREGAAMTLETAEDITNSDGVRYGDLDSEKLAAMTIGIGKAMNKTGLTPEQRETYQLKLDAIATILQARNGAQGK